MILKSPNEPVLSKFVLKFFLGEKAIFNLIPSVTRIPRVKKMKDYTTKFALKICAREYCNLKLLSFVVRKR